MSARDAARVALASAVAALATAGRPLAWTSVALVTLMALALARATRDHRARAAPVLMGLGLVACVSVVAEIVR